MGDTLSKSTNQALLDGISRTPDSSIDREKETNDFLSGVPAIVKAIAEERIRVTASGGCVGAGVK